MGSRKGYAKTKGRGVGGTFVNIPHRVINSDNYAKLSHKARALLLELSSFIVHRKGKPAINGNISAAYRIMEPLGWRSTDTVDAAEAELLHYGFIEVTQKGNRRRPTLYAVTWLAISGFEDKCWIEETKKPSCKWLENVGPMPSRSARKK